MFYSPTSPEMTSEHDLMSNSLSAYTPTSSSTPVSANFPLLREYSQTNNGQHYAAYASPDYSPACSATTFSQVIPSPTATSLPPSYQSLTLLQAPNIPELQLSPTIFPSSEPSSPPTTPCASSFDLQEVLRQFSAKPELLKLILASKVEEDKRRTAEARMRVREIDLILQQRERDGSEDVVGRPRSGSAGQSSEIDIDDCSSHGAGSIDIDKSLSGDSSYSRDENITFNSDPNGSFSSSPYSDPFSLPIHLQPPTKRSRNTMLMHHRRDSAVGSLSSLEDLMDRATPDSTMSPYFPLSPTHHSYQTGLSSSKSTSYPPTPRFSPSIQPLSPLSPHSPNEHSHPTSCENVDKRKRKRREMQAVTLIIETKDNPYVDNYLWKNNGNTTQKKTGNKSVYYKCSNSGKGCPVNKTVTYRENGVYLIKYRGEHLKECGKVKRIVNT